MKPVIGILSHITPHNTSPLGISTLGNTYVVSIEKADGVPVILPVFMEEENMDAYLDMCDGFLFSGGIDISPSYYNEEPHLKIGQTSLNLDRTQIPFMQKALKTGKPILGICRGHQVLTVATGGNLYQDLSEHEGTCVKHFQETHNGDYSHTVTLESDSLISDLFEHTIYTNSFHHQAAKDLGEGVRAIAYSQDHVIEAIQVENHKFALGIQWHPEAMFAHGDESMRPIFDAFVNACKNK